MTPAGAAAPQEAVWHIDAAEALVGIDPGGRGIARFIVPGSLARAAEALRGARRVAITTGFPKDGKGETDGPPGAAALARALLALGVEVVHVVDSRCAPLVACLDAGPVETADLTPGDRAAATALLARLDASHLVAIERPGRAQDGTYRNMRGVDITATTSGLDELFLLAAEPGPHRRPTVAVGDGGNEVGMGSVRGRVVGAVPHGEVVASVVPADHVVVAGTSNWGAWGLVAGLSVLANRDLLSTDDLARADVAAVIAAGGVDGVTGKAEPTVDGMPFERSLEVLRAVRAVVRAALQPA